MSTELSEIQKVLLDTYKAFDAFCKKHDIKFIAAYGTLLGAVRHHGFIPWDDDMDVFMVREYYEKFIKLKGECANSGNYRIADYLDEGYPYPFAKFYDNTKTFWEYKHFPFLMGPFIDVFVLDSWKDNADDEKLHKRGRSLWWKYRKSISWDPWPEILKDFITFNGFEGPIKLIKKCVYSPWTKKYKKGLNNINKVLSGSTQGEFWKDYSTELRHKYNKDWNISPIEMPFEDTTICVPNKFQEWLTTDYGEDYMTPPPIAKRSGHHIAYYMNLKKRIEVEEILKYKKKDLKPKKTMNFTTLFKETLRHYFR